MYVAQSQEAGSPGNFFAMDDAAIGERSIPFNPGNTTSYTNLNFMIDLAANDSGATNDGFPDADRSDFFAVLVSSDGGTNWSTDLMVSVVGPNSTNANKDLAAFAPTGVDRGVLGSCINSAGEVSDGPDTNVPLVGYDEFNNAPTTTVPNVNAQTLSFGIADTLCSGAEVVIAFLNAC